MRRIGLVAMVLAVTACVSGGDIVQDTTRSLARGAVDAAAGRYLPGVNVSPYTDCVINNASTGELLQLAQVAGAGAAQEVAVQAFPIVQTIASRPETTQCLLSTLSPKDVLMAQGLSGGGL
ncbi:MAG: succinate dehydrogenase [Paracoccaceae bacterium]